MAYLDMTGSDPTKAPPGLSLRAAILFRNPHPSGLEQRICIPLRHGGV
jgi:hypothetical protein